MANKNPKRRGTSVSPKLRVLHSSLNTTADKEAKRIDRANLTGTEPEPKQDSKATIKAPRVPPYFNNSQKKLWRSVTKLLLKRGLIAQDDFFMIENFVLMQDAVVEASIHIEENGLMLYNGISGAHYQNPMIKVRDVALAKSHSLARSLGLSPKAREEIELAIRRGMKTLASLDEPVKPKNSFSDL